MNSPEMHLEKPQRAQVTCLVCTTVFTPKRASWAKFCSTKCRNAFHRTLTPQALHQQIEDLKATLAAMKEEHEAIKRHVEARDGIVIP